MYWAELIGQPRKRLYLSRDPVFFRDGVPAQRHWYLGLNVVADDGSEKTIKDFVEEEIEIMQIVLDEFSASSLVWHSFSDHRVVALADIIRELNT